MSDSLFSEIVTSDKKEEPVEPLFKEVQSAEEVQPSVASSADFSEDQLSAQVGEALEESFKAEDTEPAETMEPEEAASEQKETMTQETEETSSEQEKSRTIFVEEPARSQPKNTVPAAYAQLKNKALIYLEVPGLAPEDFQLKATPKLILVSGKRVLPSLKGFVKKNWKDIEFSMTFRTPMYADLDNISAKLDRGILLIEIPVLKEKTKLVSIDETAYLR